MPSVNSYQDLVVWQNARKGNIQIRQIRKLLLKHKENHLNDQMARSASSIMDNIAEGFGRAGNREFAQHLWISRGSLAELCSLLQQVSDFEIVPRDEISRVIQFYQGLDAGLHSLIRYLEKSDYKGYKYRNR